MVPDPRNQKGKIEMYITEQELFDALTAFHKNDRRKTGISRSDGIRDGNSKWYLIHTRLGFRNNRDLNLFVYKHDDNYDFSKLRRDAANLRGEFTEWSVHWNFTIGEINSVAKRKKFSDETWVRLLNNHAEGLEEESPATEVA